MVYRRVQGKTAEEAAHAGDDGVRYRVCEGEDLAAEFGYHIERMRPEGACRFWIDGIRLSEACGTAAMEAILQFIQYKCHAAGCPSMFVRLNEEDPVSMELYQKFGFYVIDREERTLTPGQVCCESVLTYPIPASRDDVLRSHILRSERKRAKAE